MSKKEAMGKRGRLSLKELADYDDILTDALVDHVCHPFPPSVSLNLTNFRSTSGPIFARTVPNTILPAVSHKTMCAGFC
jgi:hypothetical protein